jgi:magnesium chelatase family protein
MYSAGMAVQKIMTATLVGINASLIEVEADVSNGLPTTIIVGLPDAAVQESRERVRSAIKHSGYQYPQTRISLNLAPGTLAKSGTHFDVPIALAVLLASGLFPNKISGLEKQLFAGELSLDGNIRSAPGILAMVEAARDAGFTAVFVPRNNAEMASLVKGIVIYPISNLRELILHVTAAKLIPAYFQRDSPNNKKQIAKTDFAFISGQENAKRAMEIAAAGNHNMLMTGPPGSGKSMLAKAFPSIMPKLNNREVLELTKIYNSAGRLHEGMVIERPVRSPHHTSSSVALIGGGAIPKPGEVTLAHGGVLFLDEFPEFSRSVLEVLRQPLEDNLITITRARHAYTFPASFVLIAAQNPCPCGNYSQAGLECICLPSMIEKYQKKISGPLLDRIDLHITVPRLMYAELMSAKLSEPSVEVLKRVSKAREIQTKRYSRPSTNSIMASEQLSLHCKLDTNCKNMLEQASNKYKLSGRGIHRVLKVARTIADLDNKSKIDENHLAESLQFRLRDSRST